MSTPEFSRNCAQGIPGPTMTQLQASPETKSCLPFGLYRLDAFFGHMTPGQVTFMESNTSYIFHVVYTAMASALRDPEAKVLYVDGCNSADSYQLVKLCKRYRIDPDRVLERVSVCRAFTAYQMSAIIEEQLEGVASGARLLLVAGLRELYEDRDVQPGEACVLLARAAQTIRDLAQRYGFAALVTDLNDDKREDLRDCISRASHRHLRLMQSKRKMRLEDAGSGLSADYMPVPIHQTILDEFWEVCEWAGASRPTE